MMFVTHYGSRQMGANGEPHLLAHSQVGICDELRD